MTTTSPQYRYWGSQKPRTGPRMEATAVKTGDTEATIRIYTPIDSWGGWWGVSAKEFAELLDQLGSPTKITLRLNSPGGEVTEAVAILNLLRTHAATVTAVVDGLAASAASFLAVGCDELVMGKNSELMIHDARGFVMGDAADVRKYAELLEHVSDNMAGVYAEKAGGEPAAWRALMSEETWYSAQEAVDAGLADRVGDIAQPAADPQTANDGEDAPLASWDLSIFAHAGRAAAPAPKHPTASAEGPTTSQKGDSAVAFTDAQMTTMRQELGLAEDADEATIVAALSEALNEAADPPTTPPAGTVLVEASVLDQLREQASQGVTARQQQLTEERDRTIAAAVQDGKITKAREDHWRASWDADPEGAKATLASLEPGLVVPTTAIGHSADIESTADEALYASVFGEKIGG